MPLIASAILLASNSAFAANQEQTNAKTHAAHMVRQKTGGHKGVAGTVTSISGSVLKVKGVDEVTYTVDASGATIMKATVDGVAHNPLIINISDIKVGDTIMVRGTISEDKTEVGAEKIFDGKIHNKQWKKEINRQKNKS